MNEPSAEISNGAGFFPKNRSIPAIKVPTLRCKRLCVQLPAILFFLIIQINLTGCFFAHGIRDVRRNPYQVTYEDDSTVKYGDANDDVFIEVRRAKVSLPPDNLAIHYATLFPGGEPVKPGDKEEYVKIGDKNAYRVVFKKKYIRKRKRIEDGSETPPADIPPDWTTITINDLDTGKPVPVLYGPLMPMERELYLVPGKRAVYAVFFRAVGDGIDAAKERFEKFVREDIDYK